MEGKTTRQSSEVGTVVIFVLQMMTLKRGIPFARSSRWRGGRAVTLNTCQSTLLALFKVENLGSFLMTQSDHYGLPIIEQSHSVALRNYVLTDWLPRPSQPWTMMSLVTLLPAVISLEPRVLPVCCWGCLRSNWVAKLFKLLRFLRCSPNQTPVYIKCPPYPDVTSFSSRGQSAISFPRGILHQPVCFSCLRLL